MKSMSTTIGETTHYTEVSTHGASRKLFHTVVVDPPTTILDFEEYETANCTLRDLSARAEVGDMDSPWLGQHESAQSPGADKAARDHAQPYAYLG
ncbi:hypothetical protein [Bradyrhizobium sp. USDA 223]|uniref:hypothetical protein n=1 Tax=Bradyrhizobium sp. USDA 223 TaxID=3156306 RepID=UPI003835F3CB